MNRDRPPRFGLATLCGTVMLSACSGDTLILPREGVPVGIAVLSGDGQADTVGQPLPQPLVVRITDSKNRPVQSQPVSFTPLTNGSGARLIPDTAVTDADGQTTARWELATSQGRQTIRVQVLGSTVEGPVSVDLSAMAEPDAPAAIVLVGGDGQIGKVGTQLGQPLAVMVTDRFGNGIDSVPIAWQPVAGGTVSASTTATGADGHASVLRTLGMIAGQQSTSASAPGLNGSPLIFTHTASQGQAVALLADSGDGQTGLAGRVLPRPLVARLVDANGNGVPGPAVAWAVATGGGSISPSSGMLDASGRASTILTLGPVGGPNSVFASAAGFSVLFTATGSPLTGPPASVAITAAPSAAVPNSLPLQNQPAVRVQDASGNLVGGVVVTVVIASGGGVLGGASTMLTDTGGIAAFTDLSVTGAVGARTLRFSAGAVSTTSTAILVTAGPASPAHSTGTVPNGTAGFSTTIIVLVRDLSDNLTAGGANVAVSVSGANSATPLVTDLGNGSYTAVYLPTRGGTDLVAITVNGFAIGGSPYVSVVMPAAVSASQSTLQLAPASVTASTGAGGATVSVTALDASGNPVAGAVVSFAATGTGNRFTPTSAVTDPSGQATSSYSSTVSGSRTITATAGGVTRLQTGRVTVDPGAADPALTTASLPGNGHRHRQTVITVQTRDQFGNRLTTGGHTIAIDVTGANTTGPIGATDNGDGSYTASYTPNQRGTDDIAITLDGVPIAGSPYQSRVQ